MGYTTARQIKDMFRRAMQEVNVPEDIQNWALHTQRLHRALHKAGAQDVNGQLCIDDDSVPKLLTALVRVGPVDACMKMGRLTMRLKELEEAFDDQSRELELALEFLTPETMIEFRRKAYPSMRSEP